MLSKIHTTKIHLYYDWNSMLIVCKKCFHLVSAFFYFEMVSGLFNLLGMTLTTHVLLLIFFSVLYVCLQVPPQCPPRPASYTPSSNNEPSSYNHPAAVLNNLDTLRSYGSAGDELENVPPDYLRNLNRSTPVPSIPSHPTSTIDAESLHKPLWAEMTEQMSSYTDSNKIKNGKSRA